VHAARAVPHACAAPDAAQAVNLAHLTPRAVTGTEPSSCILIPHDPSFAALLTPVPASRFADEVPDAKPVASRFLTLPFTTPVRGLFYRKPQMIRSPLITVMVNAVRKAGRSLVRDFGEVEQLQVSLKGPANFVSNADRKAEKILHDELSKARPAFGFIMEESGEVEGTDQSHRWIIDPLDGTTNFLHGIPLFCISVGLVRDGVPIAGVIYNPVADELFVAEKGAGSFLNDRRIRVAARRSLSDAVLCCGLPHMGRGDFALFAREYGAIAPKVAGIRRTGSAATDLAWVAAGRFDGFWERNLSAWDMAAGIVLIREAGGFVSDMDDADKMLTKGDIAAGNEIIRREMLGVLRKA